MNNRSGPSGGEPQDNNAGFSERIEPRTSKRKRKRGPSELRRRQERSRYKLAEDRQEAWAEQGRGDLTSALAHKLDQAYEDVRDRRAGEIPAGSRTGGAAPDEGGGMAR